jgi:Transposase DDE domain/Transposase domain (DUF772)
MLVAYRLACGCLRPYSSRFSRHDFTLPQLFACLVVKELLGRSYREAEALLADSPQWCAAIGMSRAPDHNTLCRAAKALLSHCRVSRVLDAMARWAAGRKLLRLSHTPLALDSTYCQSHHVSRHYERRCAKARHNLRKNRRGRTRPRSTARTLRRLPKLALGVAAAAHLALSVWTGTGAGSDHAHFERLLFDAWRRVPNRRLKVVADAGYDCERHHRLARRDMGLQSIIPPRIGRPTTKPPTEPWRRHMRRLLATRQRRRRCGYTQRWQVETVMSMIKRNLGDELSGKTARSRKRDLMLKVLTHNLMIIRCGRGSRQSSGDPVSLHQQL